MKKLTFISLFLGFAVSSYSQATYQGQTGSAISNGIFQGTFYGNGGGLTNVGAGSTTITNTTSAAGLIVGGAGSYGIGTNLSSVAGGTNQFWIAASPPNEKYTNLFGDIMEISGAYRVLTVGTNVGNNVQISDGISSFPNGMWIDAGAQEYFVGKISVGTERGQFQLGSGTVSNLTATGTIYAPSNNISGISAGLLSLSGAETNSSLTGGVIAADSNGKRKVASLSNLTWDGTTLAATASGGGETYSYTNLKVLNFGSTAAGITTNNGQLYAFGYSDGIYLTNCWMTAGTNEVRCTNANFVAGDVGKSMLVTQMGDASANYLCGDVSGIITNVLSSTRVLLGPASHNFSTNTTGFAGMWNQSGARFQMTNMPARYGHDDSTNLQNAINWAISNSVSKIKMHGITIVAGPFQHTSSYNSLICLPYTKTPDLTVHPLTIEGDAGPMVGGGASPMNGGTSYGTYTGGTGDGTWIMCNNPGTGSQAANTGFYESIFCGGTNGTANWPSFSVSGNNFNNIGFRLKSIGIRTASNPKMGAINMLGNGNFSAEWVNIDSTFTSYGAPLPNYVYAQSYGIAMPAPGNNGPGGNTLRNVTISSFYTGVHGSEHVNGDELFIETCMNGMQFASAYHISWFGHMMLQGCNVGLVFSDTCYVNVDALDVEHNGYPTWIGQIDTLRDIRDTGNTWKGQINYQVTQGLQASSGAYNGLTNLIVYGGTNGTLREMGLPIPARSHGTTTPGTNLIGGVLMVNLTGDVPSGFYGGVGSNKQAVAAWKVGLEIPQLSIFPTNYIPSSSSGVTNFVLLNLTNTINGGGLQFVATNTAASGSFILRKITQTETAWP